MRKRRCSAMTEEEDAGEEEEDVQLLAEMPLQEYKEGDGRWLLRCDEGVGRGVIWPPPTAPASAEGAPRTILRIILCFMSKLFYLSTTLWVGENSCDKRS